LGSMGSRIVTLMLDAGHHLTLWARRPASLEPFAGRVDVASSPAGVGETSELVGICVWDESDVDEIVLGDRGVLAGMRTGGVVAIHSTISPAACRRLQAAAADRGVGLVDAAVSVGANLPKLLVLVGGDPDDVGRCREAFESFGDPVAHLGPVGSGQIAKLVNNTLLAATVGLADDAIALGGDFGLDETALAAALAVGSSRGTWSGLLARRRTAVDSLPGRTNDWAGKDVGHTLELAAEAAIDPTREVLRLAARGVEVLG
jgi:3-hydroxyisobutyrate dehydrogenase